MRSPSFTLFQDQTTFCSQHFTAENTAFDMEQNNFNLPVTPDSRSESKEPQRLLHAKRLLPNQWTASLPVITQTSDSEMEEEEQYSQRKKMRTDDSRFSSSMDSSFNSISTPTRDTVSANIQQSWWKKKQSSPQNTSFQNNNRFASEESTCTCHVCKSNIPTKLEQAEKITPASYRNTQATAPVKQKNSLLAYFQHSKSLQNGENGPSFQTKQTEKGMNSGRSNCGKISHLCSYCDRPACSNCTRQCEGECKAFFCTFCSRVDYEGVRERIFCFHCQDEENSEECSMDTT
ncbi:hypothetical protein CTEN210_07714 [Chaetoceros tenuissimus]|uniref:Uncharacterized protein n=1 Tax=Chaetoceros tenuissimus TaxID=426638 RepID=A0AAD3CSR3_9STRA|nr:hypothetical protein CTEN210_07714 [Chaetoceros tenuissimus]